VSYVTIFKSSFPGHYVRLLDLVFKGVRVLRDVHFLHVTVGVVVVVVVGTFPRGCKRNAT
jgi:hypothetical protein